MKWLRGVIAAAVLTIVAVPVVGQAQLRFDRDGTVANATVSNSTYVGPYVAQVISAPGTPFIDVYCVDYLHTIAWDHTWYANVTALDSQTGLGMYSRSGQANGGAAAQLAYRQAAWLTTQFTAGNDWGGIHSAIWNIMHGNIGNTPQWGDYTSWIGLAQQEENYESIKLNEWRVITDVNAVGYADKAGTQEFLTRVNVVPEPATLLLMGTGLIAMAGMTVVMRQSAG